MNIGKLRDASHLAVMDEDEIQGVYAAASDLWDRVRVKFEQPTAEISHLADTTFAAVVASVGARRWHQGQLEKLVAAMNDHRRKRAQNPNTTMWLMIALTDVVGLVEPMERVHETLREPADQARVNLLLDEIRTWRQAG